MPNDTRHYLVRQLEGAGWIALAADLRKLLREYWHMKRALRQIKKACAGGSLLHIAAIGTELEKKVKL